MSSENSLSNSKKIEATHFNKEILLSTSKSHANRALIIGAIKGNNFRIDHVPNSSDVLSMIEALKCIGLKIKSQSDSLIFLNSFPLCESETPGNIIDLSTGDGGTTNRFLASLVSLGKKTYRFHPTEKMSQRPIAELTKALRELNVKVESSNECWLQITGPAMHSEGAILEVDCTDSTQFASALMLSFHQTGLKIEAKNIVSSETYLAMTRAILKEVTHKNSYNIPIDFSSLGYPVALAITNGRVLIRNCHGLDPLQADSQFIDLLKSIGADVRFSDEGLVATKSTLLKPFSADASIYPDLIPTLAFLASTIKGKSVISHLSVLKQKESDRLSEIKKILDIFKVNYHFDESLDELEITGDTAKREEVEAKTARDHRMVMMAYLFLRSHSGGVLHEVDCIKKSFPQFLEVME
jgi:3-phosphoshikimate 1-carboxyvinyltransferase